MIAINAVSPLRERTVTAEANASEDFARSSEAFRRSAVFSFGLCITSLQNAFVSVNANVSEAHKITYEVSYFICYGYGYIWIVHVTVLVTVRVTVRMTVR